MKVHISDFDYENRSIDEAAGHEMTAGSFAVMPAGMKHFGWTTGETVMQIHGFGPFQIVYVNPADDPRNVPKR